MKQTKRIMASDIFRHNCPRLYQLALKTVDWTLESAFVWRTWNAGDIAYLHSDSVSIEGFEFEPCTSNRLADFSDLADMLLVIDP